MPHSFNSSSSPKATATAGVGEAFGSVPGFNSSSSPKATATQNLGDRSSLNSNLFQFKQQPESHCYSGS